MSNHDQTMPGVQESTRHASATEEQAHGGDQETPSHSPTAVTLLPPLTSLIGREREVVAACTLLARPEVRLRCHFL